MRLSIDFLTKKEYGIALLPLLHLALGNKCFWLCIHILNIHISFSIGKAYLAKYIYSLLPFLYIRWNCTTDYWLEVDWGFWKYNNGARFFLKKK